MLVRSSFLSVFVSVVETSVTIHQKRKLFFSLSRIGNGSANNSEKQKSRLVIKISHLIRKPRVGWESGLIASLNLPHTLMKEYEGLVTLRFRLKA